MFRAHETKLLNACETARSLLQKEKLLVYVSVESSLTLG